MTPFGKVSLFKVVGLSVLLTAIISLSIYMALQYTTGRDRILARLENDGRHTASSLAASIAPYVQAYAVTEYRDLVANEMVSPNVGAIIVRDANMGQILGIPEYVTGEVRDGTGAVVEFDATDADQAAILDRCDMVYRADVVPVGGQAAGSLSVCMSDVALQADLRTLLRDSAVIGAVTALPIALMVFWVLHLAVLRPLRNVSAGVDDRDGAGLPVNGVPVQGAEEIRGLATAINRMIAMTRASRQELEVRNEELQRRRASLTVSERKLREIIWATGVGTWEWNVQTGETMFNERWAEICGYALRELEPVGIETWRRLLHPEDAARSEEALRRAFEHETEVYSCEVRMRHKDGHWVWVQDRGKVVEWDPEDRPLRMSGTHLDISRRKEREGELARLLRLNQDILDAAGEGIYGVDTEGTITFINKAACDILGFDGADLVNQSAHAAFHHHRADGSLHPEEDCASCAAYREGRVSRVEGDIFWRRDGGTVQVDYVATPIAEPGGAARGAVVVFRDVTLMRAQQNRLRKLSQAVEQSPVSVIITDRKGDIEYVNPTFETVTGYGLEEIRGTNPRFLQSGAKTSEDYQRLWETILSGHTWSGEFQNRRKDGTLFWELATIAPVLGDDGEIESFLGVKEDITDRKAMEDALTRSNEELEQFAYVASHDLREPLRMIASYTRLVEKTLGDDIPERAADFMSYVKDGALRMDQMLVALLEYSRVGRMGEPMEAVDSGALVDEALRFLAPVVEERGARIDKPDVWPLIRASRNEGVRLFQNLIGNALKYCPPEKTPHIRILVRSLGDYWEFTIADNGIGFEPDQASRLFKVFQRLHRAEKYEGTGIGLAVCRRIAERHGGSISGDSAGEGQGSAFRVRLPRLDDASS